MDRTSYENGFTEKFTEFPLSVCPQCNTTQEYPILDNRKNTINITCSKCKNKFCSYCGGDRHYLMSCRKPMPSSVAEYGDHRV